MLKAIAEARAAGIPAWLILEAILQGIPVLLELIKKFREDQPT